MNHPTKAPLSFSLGSNHLHGLLRADQIRHDTLVSLVAHWGDDEAREDVINQLDALAEAIQSPREGQLDALVQHVEDAAAMDDAETAVNMADLLRMRDELDAVIAATAGRFHPQRGASLIKHPTHAATREHLREHPLPEQQDRRTA